MTHSCMFVDVKCIRMEDITKDFKLPCVMDVKIGVQTWEPDAPEKKILVERVSILIPFIKIVVYFIFGLNIARVFLTFVVKTF